MKWLFAVLIFWSANLQAQAPPTAPTPTPAQQKVLSQADAGLESPEEARAIVLGVVKEEDQLKPLLGTLDPQSWSDKKGAPTTYVIQLQAAQQQGRDLDLVAKLFLQHIDSLKAAMDLYFWMEALETSARSLNEGAQRYADRPVAEQLATFVARNFDSRQRFREYMKDLAANLEQNYKVADEEAQRCRAVENKEPAPRGTIHKRP
jgi:hypothetical protein